MRAYNFSAGPSTLPLEVLEEAQRELLDFGGTGMSVTEISHRNKAFEAVVTEGDALLRELDGDVTGAVQKLLVLDPGNAWQPPATPETAAWGW